MYNFEKKCKKIYTILGLTCPSSEKENVKAMAGLCRTEAGISITLHSYIDSKCLAQLNKVINKAQLILFGL